MSFQIGKVYKALKNYGQLQKNRRYKVVEIDDFVSFCDLVTNEYINGYRGKLLKELFDENPVNNVKRNLPNWF